MSAAPQNFVAELVATARAIAADGKGILAADESTGTIGKRFAGINVEVSFHIIFFTEFFFHKRHRIQCDGHPLFKFLCPALFFCTSSSSLPLPRLTPFLFFSLSYPLFSPSSLFLFVLVGLRCRTLSKTAEPTATCCSPHQD
jgi:hypothetical protein